MGSGGLGHANAEVNASPDEGLSSVPVHTGYRDFNFGTAVWRRPTSEKPQSKLWWNDGVWWGCLWDPGVGAYRIHRMDVATQSWQSDGPNADDRTGALVDVLWTEPVLYILSHVFDAEGPFRIHSYTYDPNSLTYATRPGFPVETNVGTAKAVTLAKDTTGKLWIAWEGDGDVWVNRSLGDETLWGEPFRLPVQGNDTSGDISTIASLPGRIGVLWSNQVDLKIYFATHIDGASDTTWEPREEALADTSGADVVDDHINMAVSTDGTVYAVSKTGLPNPTDPRIFLLRRDPGGGWTQHVVARKEDDHSRPIVVLDDENRQVYVFAKSDAEVSGVVRMKVSDMDNIAFGTGPGTVFMRSDEDDDINDPTSTKQPLDGSMDLLVAASDEGTRYYFHNTIDLPGDGSPTPDIAVVPASNDYGSVVLGSNLEHTFEVRNVGPLSLEIASTALLGAHPEQFVTVSGGGAFTLAPGAARDIVVRFHPISLGAKSALLRIRSNDPNEDPADVALFGDCVGAGPDIAVTPNAHDFGHVPHGRSAARTFQIHNEGSAELTVTSIALVSQGSGSFEIIGGAGGFALDPGGVHDVIVRFIPGILRAQRGHDMIRDAGDPVEDDTGRTFKASFAPSASNAHEATLRIVSDDPDESPLDVVLSGTTGTRAPTGPVRFESSVDGGSSQSTTVSTTSSVVAVDSDLYLAAIATKKYKEVANVTGMGLSWTRVLAQCGGRHQTGVEVWLGSGSPSSGPVTATLVEAPDGAALIVSRYSGADVTTLGSIVGANTHGVAGPCDGGTDAITYSVPTTTMFGNGVLFTAVAMRDKQLTVDASWAQRGLAQGGSGGGTAGLVVMDQTLGSPGNVTLEGAFDEPVDWAIIAVEIGPGFAAKHHAPDSVQDVQLVVHAGRNGRVARIELASPRATSLHAVVFDVRGRFVRELFDGTMPAGRIELTWSAPRGGTQVPAGVYFLRAALDDRVLTRRILHVR